MDSITIFLSAPLIEARSLCLNSRTKSKTEPLPKNQFKPQSSNKMQYTIKHFFATLFGRKKLHLHQFTQGVIDGVGVFNIEQETNVRQALVTTPMVGVVKHQNLERGQFNVSRR